MLETVVRVGVPAAAKGTGVLLEIRDTTQAGTAGNPRPTNSGAASAAGVPNPAEPSMNAPKR